MIRISDEEKALYKADNVHKELEIRIPSANITLHNEDILSESMSLTESIESELNLSFTGCIASIFRIETVDIVQDIEGMWIEVDITPDGGEPLSLFRGYIDEVTNTTHEEYTTQILAYDALYKINNADITDWYNTLAFPMSVYALRNAFFAHFSAYNVTQESTYLVNDGMTVYKTIEDNYINGADVLKPICQINGRYGRIGRDGTFQYVHLVEGTEAIYPSEELYPADDLYPSAENALDNVNKAHYIDTTFENYRVTPIDKVQLVDKDGQIARVAGSGSNAYTVKDNPLIWSLNASQLAQVATNLYNEIQGLWYTPANINCIGLPYVECGDFVLLAARRSIIRAYVLTRELKGIQSLKDTYTAQGSKRQPIYVPTLQTQVNANKSAINSEVSRASSAESGLNSRCGNIESDVSRFKSVTADNISAINGNISNLNANVANIGSIVATKASISDLNAVNAKIDNLSARAITTGSLRSAIANLGSISVSTVNASSVSSSGVSCGSLSVGGAGVSWITRSINGVYFRYLGSY